MEAAKDFISSLNKKKSRAELLSFVDCNVNSEHRMPE